MGVNKLRTLSYGGGLLVGLTALWATISYGGSPLRFVGGFALAVVAAGLPAGLAHSKATALSYYRRYADEDAGFSEEQGAVYVSGSSVDDAFEALESVYASLEGDGTYDRIERDAFDEGPGLTVTYSGFHNCFVRVTDGGQMVVTGASKKTGTVADAVASACSLSFDRTRDNPFEGVEPVRGAPRVFLGVIVFAILLVGVGALAGGAYPSDAYNPAERTALMTIDASGDVNPGVSPTDTQLRKASFLVGVVDEEATEIRWEGNSSAEIAGHGRQAIAVSSDARDLLAAVREGLATPEQVERANRLAAELREAEQSVATALAERADSQALSGDVAALRRLGERLRADATPEDGAVGDAVTGEATTGDANASPAWATPAVGVSRAAITASAA
ncbi:hypothetical protein [Halococcus salifodinae]|uniref:Uncharacterized protein n=1 Tax=Halococcus salifodinae DSM 8989 TaxID=1227456 RepID=M0NAX4_9EURY|nr:hypothetical protein [Halococcus salifodinae]EMA54254.1 hypothetical protein C450_06652 [Halococcus salifodinae DSM 8989]